MTQKRLIFISSALFVAGSAFLFWQNERELDPDRGKNWWVVSFASPQDPADLSFTIENHSDQEEFRYEIIAGKTVLTRDIFSVRRGETLTINPPLSAKTAERTTVTTSAGKEKKEIYR
ncbi:MAG: hypothetical protein AAB547_00555 [Patescibacteria group bacterium]